MLANQLGAPRIAALTIAISSPRVNGFKAAATHWTQRGCLSNSSAMLLSSLTVTSAM